MRAKKKTGGRADQRGEGRGRGGLFDPLLCAKRGVASSPTKKLKGPSPGAMICGEGLLSRACSPRSGPTRSSSPSRVRTGEHDGHERGGGGEGEEEKVLLNKYVRQKIIMWRRSTLQCFTHELFIWKYGLIKHIIIVKQDKNTHIARILGLLS